MDFADLLSQGPLASVLNDYKKTQQNVLNRKVITKRERDNEELKRIQQMNHEYNAKKVSYIMICMYILKYILYVRGYWMDIYLLYIGTETKDERRTGNIE